LKKDAHPVALGDKLDGPDGNLGDIERLDLRAVDIVPDLDLSVAIASESINNPGTGQLVMRCQVYAYRATD